MSFKAFSRLNQTQVHSNPYWRHQHDEYVLPNGSIGTYDYIETQNSILILPQLQDGRFVWIRQFRYIQQTYGIELPGGGCSTEHTHEETAQKELLEETGYTAQHWVKLGRFSPCVGLIDEWCDVFLASGLLHGDKQLEVSEDIELCILSPEEVDAAILSGDIWSGMSQSAWMLYRLSKRSM